VRELAVPTTFLSKNAVDHTWQGTKDPPRIPTKNLTIMRPVALFTVPASAVGIAPMRRHEAKVTLGPKRSHNGPAMRRMRRLEQESAIGVSMVIDGVTHVAVRAIILELAISF
jgi:hypothetical protein